MAKLVEGAATMRTNDVLEDDEIADGYILTCQAVPDTPSVTGGVRVALHGNTFRRSGMEQDVPGLKRTIRTGKEPPP